MRSIQPCYIKIKQTGSFRITYDNIGLYDTLIFIFCQFSVASATLHFLPEFVPNDLMLDRFADKGKSDWEIYAWCVRDILSRLSETPKVEKYISV